MTPPEPTTLDLEFLGFYQKLLAILRGEKQPRLLGETRAARETYKDNLRTGVDWTHIIEKIASTIEVDTAIARLIWQSFFIDFKSHMDSPLVRKEFESFQALIQDNSEFYCVTSEAVGQVSIWASSIELRNTIVDKLITKGAINDGAVWQSKTVQRIPLTAK